MLKKFFRNTSLWVGVGLIFCLLGLVPLIHGIYLVINRECCGISWNSIGDYVGGTSGALWSLGGILFVYAAFIGQQDQLDQQKDEAIETNKRIAAQNFETLLFQILQLHNDRVHNFDLNSGQVKGVDCFKTFFEKLEYFYTNSDKTDEQDKLKDSFEKLKNNYKIDIPLYFNSLEGILKHISQSIHTDHNKYFKVIYHQFSLYEIALVYLYSKVSESDEEYSDLFKDEAVIKNVKNQLNSIKSNIKFD